MHDRLRFLFSRQSIPAALVVLAIGIPGVVRAVQPQVAEIPEISAGAEALQTAGSPEVIFTDRIVPGGEVNPLAPALTSSWDAIEFYANAVNTGFYQIPPDPIGAAGLNHVVNVVNCTIQWWTKTGTVQNTQRLGRNAAGSVVGAFFETLVPANSLYDPKVIYDPFANRFVVVALEQVTSAPTASRILLAVSDDADPNGTWYFTAINSKLVVNALDTWADYPGFAVDGQVVYITTNQFSFANAFQGSRLWIVDKSAFYAGGAAAFTVWDPSTAVGQSATTAQPAAIYGAGPGGGVGTWLVRYGGYTDGTNEYLSIIQVNNPLGVPTFSHQFVAVGDIDTATGTLPRSPQLGTTIKIDTGDRRCLQAVWRNNMLYAVADVNPPASNPETGQCTAHWFQLDVSTFPAVVVVDQGNIGGEDVATATHTSYPSIAVNSYNDIAIGFAASAATIYEGAYFTGRRPTDPAGTVRSTGILAPGTDWYVRTFTQFSAGRNRWGDYSGTAVDPDGCTFWHFNEFAMTRGHTTTVGGTPEDGQWKTHWGSWTFCTPVPVELAYFTAERNGESAVLRWSVSSSTDHAGFNVYRSTPDQDRILISTAFLSGRSDYEFVDPSAPVEGEYWLQEVSRSGQTSWFGPATLAPATFRVPSFRLSPSQPNPFQTATTVAYSLPSQGSVHLAVYDAMGRRVATLVEGVQDAGDHTVVWDGQIDGGAAAAAGFYVIRLEAGGNIRTQKIVMAR